MRNRVHGSALVLLALLVSHAAAASPPEAGASLEENAERYFRGVYGCDPAVVDELASDDVVLSYPVVQTIFGKPALRGRDEVRGFAERFCTRWAEPEFQIHDTLADDDRVVLVWSFSATPAEGEAAPRASWGGITLFRFDSEGRITHEIGEESTPGPMGRLEGAGSE